MDRLTNGTQSRISLRLQSSLASIEKMEATAVDFAQRAGFDADTGVNIAIVTREAAANAVLHGNKHDANRFVTASFEISPDALTIRICDEGEGLDPTAIADPLGPENLLRSSGRGVFLMRALMDEVNFCQLFPGTEITLVKRRTS